MSSFRQLPVGTTIRSSTSVNYRIIQYLGKGGNSIVFLALALNGPSRGVLFALKIFTRMTNPERLEQFKREADFLRTCDHPSIMRIYDSGVYNNRETTRAENLEFVVVEYLPNTLHSSMRGIMSTAEAVSYTLQLLSALSYLSEHEPVVVHRDIKPQNIFIKGRSCVLGDFGLMKFLEHEDEMDRAIYKMSSGPGMPWRYRTPDLVAYANNERPLDEKTDIFQLGLVVSEMFTGYNPLKRAEHKLAPVELEERKPVLPGSSIGLQIQELIEEMLNVDPDIRPSAEELVEPWEGVFRQIIDLSHELNGRVF